MGKDRKVSFVFVARVGWQKVESPWPAKYSRVGWQKVESPGRMDSGHRKKVRLGARVAFETESIENRPSRL